MQTINDANTAAVDTKLTWTTPSIESYDVAAFTLAALSGTNPDGNGGNQS